MPIGVIDKTGETDARPVIVNQIAREYSDLGVTQNYAIPNVSPGVVISPLRQDICCDITTGGTSGLFYISGGEGVNNGSFIAIADETPFVGISLYIQNDSPDKPETIDVLVLLSDVYSYWGELCLKKITFTKAGYDSFAQRHWFNTEVFQNIFLSKEIKLLLVLPSAFSNDFSVYGAVYTGQEYVSQGGGGDPP